MSNKPTTNTSGAASASFGVPGHRGVPLIFAWGIHIGLSYQRLEWKQASPEEIRREGIDRFVKWGANLVEIFPSNKEAHFSEYTVKEDYTVPVHLFREHPDADQQHRWTLDDFLALNRHAHENDFLITWMIHCWWPAPVARRARVLWRLLRQLGQDTGDVLADGFAGLIDGFAVEGDFMMPQAANDLLWPFHPGMFVRESAWGLNTTTANFIHPRGFHLTDGRVLMYEREDYMGLAPECWRGYEQIWRGEEVKLRHGRLFVSLQAEGRDLACQDAAWADFGGMATVDMLVEQVNNYARAKGRGWTTAGTTAVRVINEPLLSPKMKRYMAGICGDPVRCAVAAPIEATGSDGRYHRVEYPQGTWFCQNNFFRLYLDKDTGSVSIHSDGAAQANFTNFIWETSAPLLDDLITTEFAPGAELRFLECYALEESGAAAGVRQRLEYRAGSESMGEFRDFCAEADNPWLWIRVQRVFLGEQTRQNAATTVHLPGYRPLNAVVQDCAVRLQPPDGKPPLWVYVEAGNQIDSLRWHEDGRLEINCRPDQSHDFRVGLRIGDPKELEPPDRDDSARFNARPIEYDWRGRTGQQLVVENPTAESTVRTVRILNPPPGPYLICEEGWWQPRGAQPSRDQPGTDLVKVVLSPGRSTRIRAAGFIDGLVKSGWGCQYTQLVRDVEPIEGGVRATVRVVDVNPKIWAPRLHFSRPIAEAEIDGRDWRYFDGPFLFLPNHRRDYQATVRFGQPSAPHLACTFACVEGATWDGTQLVVRMALPEWCDSLPADSRYYLAVQTAGLKLETVEGGQIVRSVPDFDAVKPMPMCGPDGVAKLIPRDYNHPPIDGYKVDKGLVIAFEPVWCGPESLTPTRTCEFPIIRLSR